MLKPVIDCKAPIKTNGVPNTGICICPTSRVIATPIVIAVGHGDFNGILATSAIFFIKVTKIIAATIELKLTHTHAPTIIIKHNRHGWPSQNLTVTNFCAKTPKTLYLLSIPIIGSSNNIIATIKLPKLACKKFVKPTVKP